MPINLNRLNPPQREAVCHHQGPLLILAGAGSGKTSTMTYRIAYLISEKKIPPSAILGLSFTNKAASELKERVKKLVSEVTGKAGTRDLTISTFHSLCVRILRAHGKKLGFRSDFSILDENDQKDLLRQIMKNIHIDERKFDLDRILFEIGQAKNRFLPPSKAEEFFLESGRLKSDYGIATASSYTRYQEQLRVLNSMDFDDLLFNAVQLLEEHEEVREYYNNKFKYILVDEYQDTNPSQFRLLHLLTRKQQNICVVGDDDQSIYAWRGADPSHILHFSEHFPNAKTILLDQNYRSTNTILTVANQVIKNNRHRHSKKLWSERGEGEPLMEIQLENDREEAKFVAEEIFKMNLELKKLWKDFAILYRSNSQSRVFEEQLRILRVPYHLVGGYSFLERKEVKNTLAYWRVILNPNDDASFRRILNWPSRGLGRTTLETLGNHAFQNHQSLFQALSQPSALSPKALPAALHFKETLMQLRVQLDTIAAPSLSGALPQLLGWARGSIETLHLKKGVEEDSDDPAQAARRWENVEELLHALGQISPEELFNESHLSKGIDKHPGVMLLREFIARMTLDPQDEEEEEGPKNEVTLMTLHGAKGLEFPVVFMVGMEDGFLPHQRSIDTLGDLDEERRLCYVGITRAKDRLLLTRAKHRIRFGKEIPRIRSRFCDEIPKEFLIFKDETGSVDSFDAKAREEHEIKVKNYLADIKGRLLKKT